MTLLADRVRDTTTSTSTGPITLDNVAPTGMRTFASAFGSGSTQNVGYVIQGQTGGEWEVGEGTFNGTTGLTRDRVLSSSNAGALVPFSAGTKDVFCAVGGTVLRKANPGYHIAISRGFAMP